MKKLVFLLFIILSSNLYSQSILGEWKTIDDETKEPKSVVLIYQKGDLYFGKILDLINPENVDPRCVKCEDDRKDNLIVGMEIIRDMEVDGDEYDDGTICDPKTGEIYDCKLWIDEDEPDKLNVRGYVFLFYRTQIWERVR